MTEFMTSHSQLKDITETFRIVYTENTVCIRTEGSIHIVFKPSKRWNIVKVRDKNIPRGNGIRKETVHVYFCMHFCPGTMTTHAESIDSDLQRGLDRRLRNTQH